MTDTETVYMNRGQKAEVYHTDEHCERLPNDSDRVRTVERIAVEPHYSECEYCQGRNLSDRTPPAEYFEFGGGP